jgi:mandelate racemase
VVAAIGRFDVWPLILVDVEVGGVVGHSYVAPYRASAVPAVAAAIADLAAALKGEPLAPVEIFERSARMLNVVGTAGVSVAAISALDMAFWDARAKLVGLPLAELLGATVGNVRAYNSNGLWRHEISTLGREARELAEEGGFTAMKLRLGNERLEADLASIAAVRDGTGRDLDLMVDFNQAFGPGDALRRCRDLDGEGLYWLEEPVAYDNMRAFAELARAVRTPLQLGENFYGPRDLLKFLAAGPVPYAMGDLMRIGGVTGWIRTASVAGAAGTQFSNHLYPEIAAHLLRATPTAHWLEWVDWATPIIAEPIVPQAGYVAASASPGSGVAWNETAVARYSVSL